MDGCPGKVTKPLDHKGTLTTTLSLPACLPVVMAMSDSPAGRRLAADSTCGWGHCVMRKQRAQLGLFTLSVEGDRRETERSGYENIRKGSMKILSHSGY